MRRTFVVGHWALTLLLAPFTSQALQYILLPNPHRIAGLLEVYPIALIFSIAFSLPTFLVYLTCFHFLSKQNVNWRISKLILIAVSVIGICITMSIIQGSMSQDMAIAYSLTALIAGLLLKLKRTKEVIHEQSILT
jgi:Sec-independent protein secretion pathway component TatC